MPNPVTGFIKGNVDVGNVYVTKEYLIDYYSELIPAQITPQLWTWGSGDGGQLGDGTTSNRSSPVTTAGGGTNWKQVSASGSSTAAIKTDGTLWTWGLNIFGELGTGTTASRSSPGTTAGGGTNWNQVSCGALFTAAIKTDGTLWTWGYNIDGQLGDGTVTSRRSPGTTAGGGTNWKQVVSGGSSSTAAIKTDGTLWTWGYNGAGELGTGNTTPRSSPGTTAGGGTNWKQVSIATSNSVCTAAIKTDGTLWTWGDNSYGQLGTGNTTPRSSPGTTAGGGTNWKQVSCGYNYIAAIKTDGTLWTWGDNTSGQLGDGTTTSRSSPGTTAGGGTNWKQVSAGNSSTAAIKTDGTLWTWGRDTYGELGDGTTTNRSSPGTTAGGGSNWKQVSVCGSGGGAAAIAESGDW